MADEPSDACSRTDGDVAKRGLNKKRKSTKACSYPNKKYGSETRNKREKVVICIFVAVVMVLLYFLNEEDTADEDEEDEDKEERAHLLRVVQDCIIKVKACAESELGPGNPYIEKILGSLRKLQAKGSLELLQDHL